MKRVLTLPSFFSIIVFISSCNPVGQEDIVLLSKIKERKTFNGKCLMILQSQLEKSVITVEAF